MNRSHRLLLFCNLRTTNSYLFYWKSKIMYTSRDVPRGISGMDVNTCPGSIYILSLRWNYMCVTHIRCSWELVGGPNERIYSLVPNLTRYSCPPSSCPQQHLLGLAQGCHLLHSGQSEQVLWVVHQVGDYIGHWVSELFPIRSLFNCMYPFSFDSVFLI